MNEWPVGVKSTRANYYNLFKYNPLSNPKYLNWQMHIIWFEEKRIF